MPVVHVIHSRYYLYELVIYQSESKSRLCTLSRPTHSPAGSDLHTVLGLSGLPPMPRVDMINHTRVIPRGQ